MTNAEAIQAERQRIASLGGHGRAKLPKKKLSAIGKKAARARWKGHKAVKTALASLLLLASLASPLHAQTVQPKLDWSSLIAAAATSSADTLSTIHALNTGACHEANPLLGRQPSHSALWVSTALSVTGLIALNYTAKHMRDHGTFYRRLSRGINWGIAGLEGSVTIHNLHICS